MTQTTDNPQPLLEYLRERDVACPLCGYNLRALSSARCPECGRELQLTVGLAEPFMRAWVVLASAAFAGAGIGLLFVLLTIKEGWPRHEPVLMKVSVIYFEASILFTIPVLLARRRFLRWPLSSQWIVANVMVALTLAGMVGFFLGLR
jgi:hypothetical protein